MGKREGKVLGGFVENATGGGIALLEGGGEMFCFTAWVGFEHFGQRTSGQGCL